MNIVIAADHGGVVLKAHLKPVIEALGHSVTDLGTASDQAVDYPDYAHQVATRVVGKEFERGILICGTGVGMSIAANRHIGIRAVVCSDTFSARYSRLHNDANVLCLGGRVVGFGLAEDLVGLWLATSFESGERHARRVGKIEPR